MTSLLLIGVVWALTFVPSAVYSKCPGADGSDVKWWILYQQKKMPLFHFYVDNTDNRNIQSHEPEKTGSVLSKAIIRLIDDDLPEYFVYSSDLVNAFQISEQFPYPTYSRYSHGILAADKSLSNGFWIIHNNLFFPPMKHGKLAPPTSEIWTLTTMGDTSNDIFYICFSIDDKTDLEKSLLSIAASNPFVHISHMSNLNYADFSNKIVNLNSSFSLERSAMIFMDCLYATDEETREKCLFRYHSSDIHVFTRPRGMVRGSRGFCYNHKAPNRFEFLDVTASHDAPILSDNIFAVSEKAGSRMSKIVCFGRDIAAHTDVVAVMVCTELPNLWLDLLKSSKVTKAACKQTGPGEDNSGKISGKQQELITRKAKKHADALSKRKRTPSRNESSCNDCQNSFTYQTAKTDIYRGTYSTEKLDILTHKTPDVKIPSPTVLKIEKLSDVNVYLEENMKHVLAVFCRDGCSFCRRTENILQIIRLLNKRNDLDIVVVDISHVDLPPQHQVHFVPVIRFKHGGVIGTSRENWRMFEESKFTLEKIWKFLEAGIARKLLFKRQDMKYTNMDMKHSKAKRKYESLQRQRRVRRSPPTPSPEHFKKYMEMFRDKLVFDIHDPIPDFGLLGNFTSTYDKLSSVSKTIVEQCFQDLHRTKVKKIDQINGQLKHKTSSDIEKRIQYALSNIARFSGRALSGTKTFVYDINFGTDILNLIQQLGHENKGVVLGRYILIRQQVMKGRENVFLVLKDNFYVYPIILNGRPAFKENFTGTYPELNQKMKASRIRRYRADVQWKSFLGLRPYEDVNIAHFTFATLFCESVRNWNSLISSFLLLESGYSTIEYYRNWRMFTFGRASSWPMGSGSWRGRNSWGSNTRTTGHTVEKFSRLVTDSTGIKIDKNEIETTICKKLREIDPNINNLKCCLPRQQHTCAS